MSLYELVIFTQPDDASAELVLDNGTHITGVPTDHPANGAKATKFPLPEDTPQGNGFTLLINKKDKTSIEQHGVLFIRTEEFEHSFPWWFIAQTAAIAVDVFKMKDKEVIIIPPPVVIPPPELPGNDPWSIINSVWNTGQYELVTKEGCGKFTEACCKELHEKNSPFWGFIKKFPPQNMYNGHAVDSVMLMVTNGPTVAGGYDIITDSESVRAKPGFNRSGDPDRLLWYYPL